MFVSHASPWKLIWPRIWRVAAYFFVILSATISLAATETVPAVKPPNDDRVLVRDITTIAGVRDNPLIGYGIVVGLHGTGDSLQTVFSTQTLANVMQRMGIRFPPTAVRINNVAAVFVTAKLPAFARPGMKLDVTVSSTGDAKSLEGGVLLLTPLSGPDGETYASAQGPLILGAYTAGAGGNTKQVNHTTVGAIPEGGTVERGTAIDLRQLPVVSLMLRDPDFTASIDIAAAINKNLGAGVATSVDSRRIDISVGKAGIPSVPELISRVQNLSVIFHPPAKVVIDERNGTIVMGGDVKLSAVSVLHGNLNVEVTTLFNVSQPEPFSKNGDTVVVPQTSVSAGESPVGKIQLGEGASVEDLVNGLHAAGATARDVVAILQAIKAAGGLRAELEIL
jgi:flagellar P-ring protein precursor FlgI